MVTEKDTVTPPTKEGGLPLQSADFLLISERDAHFTDAMTAKPLMYLPLFSKLSLHKNKKKRDLKRSIIYDDEPAGGSTARTAAPLKLSESLADRFLIGARGYTEAEIAHQNTGLRSLHALSEIKESSMAAGIIAFRDKEEVKMLEKNEAKYLKGLFKKQKKGKKEADGDAEGLF